MAQRVKAEVVDPFNEVHKLQIYKEVVDWNKRYESFSGKYRINPFHIPTITPKPNQVDPTRCGNETYVPTIYRDPTQEAFSSNYLRQTISHSRMTPGQKHRLPQTSAQEVGWQHHPVVSRNVQSQWHFRPKSSCYETHFANEYFKSSGDSPYKSNKRR